MITHSQATKLVPKPQGITVVKYQNGLTKDIIQVILEVFKNNWRQVQHFAPLFAMPTLSETCQAIHSYIRQNIRYKLDTKGEQLIKRPSAIIHQAEGDCKAYSILTASILQCLHIPFAFRFVKYNAKRDFTHVYVVAGKEQIPIDACISTPNAETKYFSKLDYDMTQIAEIGKANCTCENGIGCTCNPIKKYSFQIEKPIMQNLYDDEISGLFKKKEGGTKVGNFLRKANEFAQKSAPLVSALPIPGAQLAAKVLKAGSKVYNVVDKVTKMPKAVPLKEVINTVKAEFAPAENFDPSQAVTLEKSTTTETPAKKEKSNLPLILAAGAAAFFIFGDKRKRK
jgi:hypothetical protein